MNEGKKQIIDLVNKIKYEVSEQQLAELSGCATPLSEAEFVDWHAKIDDLHLEGGVDCPWINGKMASQLRDVLHCIADKSCEIGGHAVQIGKRAIKWIFSLLEHYPATLAAAVVMAALAFLVASIPVLHYILLPVVQVAGVAIVGFVFLKESVVNMAAGVNIIR